MGKKKLGIHNIFLTADLFSSTDWNIWNKIIVSRLEKKKKPEESKCESMKKTLYRVLVLSNLVIKA